MDQNFIAVDFETATPKRWSICACGIVVFINGFIVEKYYSLIKPPDNKYNERNIKIHGITPEMTKDQPTFDQIWDMIVVYFLGNLVVSHNTDFDIDALYQTLDYYEIDNPKFDVACTYKIFGKKLKTLCEDFNLKLSHHDPLSDAEACGKIYLKYLNNDDKFEIVTPISTASFKVPEAEWHKPISGDVLKPDFEHVFDKTNPFYMKKVVISGTYDFFERKEIARIIKDLGGDIDTTVGKKTNRLISGANTGPKKLERILKLQDDGFDAKIINEKELIKIFTKYKMI